MSYYKDRVLLTSVLLLLVEGFLLCHGGETRKLTVILTDCQQSSDFKYNNLVYVKAEGENDTVHHVWSSIGSFTVLNALTSNSSQLKINCSEVLQNLPGALHFTEEPYYSFAVVVTRLYQYNDSDNSGNIPDTNDTQKISSVSVSNLTWSNATVSASGNEVDVKFIISQDNNDTFGYDAIQFRLSTFGFEDRASAMPCLIHTPNSVQLDLILDNVTWWRTLPSYSQPRFAVEMLLLGDVKEENFTMSFVKSIDDEYTPGVFKLMQLESASVIKGHQGGYVQWKPTVYTTSKRNREDSTETHEYPLNSTYAADDLHGSVAYGYYGPDLSKVSIQSFNISFGMTDDEFYVKTNYSLWTLAVGYGTPPKDTISSLVIIVISVGLGIPSLLLVGGFTFKAVRSRVKKDDLLLSSEH